MSFWRTSGSETAGQRFVVEWNGRPVQSIDKAFANVVAE
jgi:hypothetical protein